MPHEEPENDDLTPADRELEDALRGLRPGAAGIDPLAIAFAAGAASTRRSLFMWRSAAAVLVMALGASLVVRTAQPTVRDTILVQHQPRTTSPFTYLTMETRNVPSPWRLRDRVLDQGLDALVVPTHSPATGDEIPRASDITWKPS